MPMIQGARRFSTDPFIDAANQNTSAWQARIQENNLRYGNSGMLAVPQSQPQMPYGQMPMYYGPPQKRPRLTINRGEFGAPPQTGQTGQAAGTQDNPVMQMLASGQDAMNQANKANLERFNKIMEGYLKRHDKGMDLADARANQAYKEMAGNASQQMVNRGMFNSMEAARKQFDSFEKSRQIPLDQFNRTSADPLLFAERRNDTGPDMGQLLQLAQMAGQSQSGIAGQSSPLSQGVNVGQYPAMQGIQAVQQRQSAPKKMGSPIFAGVMNPFGMMASSGVGGGGFSPYGLSQRQMQNKANRQEAGGYDAWRAQGGQQGQQQQPQQAGQTRVGANAQWWNAAPQKSNVAPNNQPNVGLPMQPANPNQGGDGWANGNGGFTGSQADDLTGLQNQPQQPPTIPLGFDREGQPIPASMPDLPQRITPVPNKPLSQSAIQLQKRGLPRGMVSGMNDYEIRMEMETGIRQQLAAKGWSWDKIKNLSMKQMEQLANKGVVKLNPILTRGKTPEQIDAMIQAEMDARANNLDWLNNKRGNY